MGLLGKVVIISCGVFIGGGIGFYLKETYYVKLKRDRCYQLQEELKGLSNIRKEKEKQLNSIQQQDGHTDLNRKTSIVHV